MLPSVIGGPAGCLGFDAMATRIPREPSWRRSVKGVFLHDGDDCVSYAYVSAIGHVGPLAVAQAHLMKAAFRTAVDLATADGAAQASAFLPGVSEALGIALKQHMRIAFPMVTSRYDGAMSANDP